MLVDQYEMFKMLEHKNIDDMTIRFMYIINQLKALGKRYSNVEMVRKILRSLSKAWRPKVTVIQEAKDLNVLSLDALIGSLMTHKIELNEASEESIVKDKSIALKFTQRKASSINAMMASKEMEEEEESSDDENEEEKDEIAHLVEKISKAWIRKKKKKKMVAPKKEKKGKAKQNEIICHECKEPRHLRFECPKLKKSSRKKTPKKKAMMVIWEDLMRSKKVQNLKKKRK